MFEDRRDAGRQLAQALRRLPLHDPVVLALPRGGVPVAVEVAQALDAPLDLLLVRKIGAPFQPELALAAVAEDGSLSTNEDLVDPGDSATRAWIDREAARQLDEIARRRQLYLGERASVPLAGRTAIVVDDGIATGATVRAALGLLRQQRPARIVLAVPVAPRRVVEDLRAVADDVVCLDTPTMFEAVGRHYRRFGQVGDEEVATMLGAAAT